MTNYLDWKVGDEVECIDASIASNGTICELSPSVRYIIKSIGYKYSWYSLKDTVMISIEGLRGLYDASRFRKLQKRKTDISVFTAMLNQTELTNKIELEVKERIKDVV